MLESAGSATWCKRAVVEVQCSASPIGAAPLHHCTSVSLTAGGLRAKSTRHAPAVTLVIENKMGDQAKKPRGNPAWHKGMPSPCPGGRPKSGHAAYDKIQDRFPVDEWIDFELAAARNPDFSHERRSSAWHALVDRGFIKPPVGIDARLSQADASQHDFESWPVERLRALNELIDAPLGEQPNGIETQPSETTDAEVKP